MQSLTQEKGIRVIDNAQITHFSPDTVTLASGEKLPFKYAMVLPPFRGAQFLRDVPGLTPESGFMPITETMQHPDYPNIFTIGVAVQLAQFDKNPGAHRSTQERRNGRRDGGCRVPQHR